MFHQPKGNFDDKDDNDDNVDDVDLKNDIGYDDDEDDDSIDTTATTITTTTPTTTTTTTTTTITTTSMVDVHAHDDDIIRIYVLPSGAWTPILPTSASGWQNGGCEKCYDSWLVSDFVQSRTSDRVTNVYPNFHFLVGFFSTGVTTCEWSAILSKWSLVCLDRVTTNFHGL